MHGGGTQSATTRPGVSAVSTAAMPLRSGARTRPWRSRRHPRSSLDPVGEGQRGGTEVMHVDVARTEELRVLEMVVLEVLQAVAHVVLAGKERLLPEHFAVAQDPALALQVARQFADPQLRPVAAGA